MEKEKQLIFGNRCAGWLMLQGFVLQDILKRDKGENRLLNVYVFNKSDSLLLAIEKYKENYN